MSDCKGSEKTDRYFQGSQVSHIYMRWIQYLNLFSHTTICTWTPFSKSSKTIHNFFTWVINQERLVCTVLLWCNVLPSSWCKVLLSLWYKALLVESPAIHECVKKRAQSFINVWRVWETDVGKGGTRVWKVP